MLRWFSPYFWFSFLLFSANQVLERFHKIPLLYSYLDDLLAPGIVLGVALFFFQKVFPADPSFVLDGKLLIVFVLLYSLLFEVIFPYTDARHTSDYWDILAYSMGTIIFRFWGNQPLTKKQIS
jgi:hypothetical protein